MKIALLVFPLHYSHGCILQTYALYSKLKGLGHDVTILDRQPRQSSTFLWGLKVIKRMMKVVLKGYRGGVFYKGAYPKEIMAEQQAFIDCFRNDVISVHSSLELQQQIVSVKYDAIVVGSDQTWRPKNVPNVMDYWLDCISNMKIRRIAYAPSFGVDKWEYDKKQTKRCKALSALFEGISVREKSGVRLCKETLGIEVQHVLDPTMLWDKSFYEPISKDYFFPKGLCQCYFLDRTVEKEYIANQIASLKNLTINYVNTRTEDGNAPIKERIAPSIEKWLAGFFYADFVVVDSFHAMVFSILFQKPFIVIGNRRRGMSRFESLLEELDLMDRLVTGDDSYKDIIGKEINWTKVNTIINGRRDESLRFLIKSLRGI